MHFGADQSFMISNDSVFFIVDPRKWKKKMLNVTSCSHKKTSADSPQRFCSPTRTEKKHQKNTHNTHRKCNQNNEGVLSIHFYRCSPLFTFTSCLFFHIYSKSDEVVSWWGERSLTFRVRIEKPSKRSSNRSLARKFTRFGCRNANIWLIRGNFQTFENFFNILFFVHFSTFFFSVSERKKIPLNLLVL